MANTILSIYVVSIIFILIGFLKPLQSFFTKGTDTFDLSRKKPTLMGKVLYIGFIIFLFSIIFYFGFGGECREDFFFTVSKCNAKCSGTYKGKPATFQFSEIKNEGVDCKDNCPSYGMIRGCPDAQMYGKGIYPDDNNPKVSCREGVC